MNALLPVTSVAFILGILWTIVQVARAGDSFWNAGCGSKMQMGNSSGKISIGQKSKQVPLDYFLFFPNISEFFMVNLSMSTKHQSSSCLVAIDYVIFPNGKQSCGSNHSCNIFVSPTADMKDLEKRFFTSPVGRRCGKNLTRSIRWPPTICIKGRLKSFEMDMTYQYVDFTDEKPANKQQSSSASRNLIIALALIIPAIFIVIAVAIVIQQRKRRLHPAADIAPYAVHVSIRRGHSLSTRSAFRTEQAVANNLDAVGQAVIEENAYLKPLTEGTYCEIQNACSAESVRYISGERFEENRSTEEETRAERVYYRNYPECNVGIYIEDNQPFSNGQFLPVAENDDGVWENNLSDSLLRNNEESHTPYSEIVCTINESGSRERLNPCKDVYKSVRRHET